MHSRCNAARSKAGRARQGRFRHSPDGLRAILRSPNDAPARAEGQRPARVLEALALLHLDEGELFAFERYEVDFADGGLVALRDDAVTFQPKQKRGNALSEQPPAISPDAILAHGRSLLSRSSTRPSS